MSEAIQDPVTNLAFFNYGADTSGVAAVAGPGSIIVSGRTNRYDPAFQIAQAQGAEVLAYLSLVVLPGVSTGPIDEGIYGDFASAPFWPYPTPAGRPHRLDGSRLLDIRVGADWPRRCADYLAGLIREQRFSGAFLDLLGGNLYAVTDFANWPANERAEWRAGAVDLMRLLDEARRAEDSNFILTCNNRWDTAPEGEQYCNGIALENMAPIASHLKLAARPYAPDLPRRVIVITGSAADAATWSSAPGVTHLAQFDSTLATPYARPMVPSVPYTDVVQAQVQAVTLRAELAEAQADAVALEAAHESARSSLLSTSAELQRAYATIESARSAARTLFGLTQEEAA